MSETKQLLEEGITLLRRGRTQKARACFERANKESPGDPFVLSFLGVSLALTDKNYKDGEDYCFRAVLKAMASAQLHANLAWIYHLQGKRKSAVESIQNALDREPKNQDALRIQGILGTRQSPPLSFLSRSHPINRAIGKLTHKLKNGR